MNERDVFIKGKLDEINNELENTFLTGERKEVLLKDRAEFEQELANWEAAKQAQEEQEQAAQLRIQAHEENREGLAQFVQELGLFELFFPQVKYAAIMGLSEYIEKQQDFNQLLHQSFVQVEDQRMERQEQELTNRDDKIAERDEKIAALKSAIIQNGEEHKVQLDKLKEEHANALDGKQNEIDELQQIIKSLESDISKIKIESAEDLANEAKKLADLKEENERLNYQLEVNKGKSNPKFTESMSDLLTRAKIKSAAEIAAENAVPFRGKVEVPKVDLAVAPSALEVPSFLQAYTVDESTVVGQFRQDTEYGLVEGDTSGEMAAQEDLGATFEERFARVEELVAKLHLHEDGSVTWDRSKLVKGQEVA